MAKMLGGIFLIVGISIGAGILALPITTAPSGFIPSTLLLFGCWVFMTFNALLILEVNLWMPENSNMITMAGATLGKGGQAIAWVSYLLLFYSLLSAYISAGSDVLGGLLSLAHIEFASTANIILFTGLLGIVVYRGTRSIDYLNRALMMVKIGTFLLLLVFIVPYTQVELMEYEKVSALPSTLMVVITSFGFATLVPSLRTYFKSDAKKLRQVILCGSLIPLVFYICWDGVILGALPLEGDHGLQAVLDSDKPVSQLIFSLQHLLNNDMVTSFARTFSAICVATSFLGVSLSLSDFLADGLHLKKQGQGALFIYSFTFVPPVMTVLFYPSLFIAALGYAGTYCTVLLALLPVLMTWVGRYYKQQTGAMRLPGGKPLLLLSFVVTIVVLIFGIRQEFGL